MQLVGDYHPNIIGAIDILQDEDSLYTVMPYCSGGDLFGRIVPEETNVVSEARARAWFRQLLAGLFHLQRKGVCHRDLCLENLLLDEKDNLVIIDLGMSLRVPYTDSVNIGCVTDASEGTERRLMVAQGQGGRLMYLAPEQVTREEAFDGFTIDLWAAGVILFIMLVGMAPFKWAHESDSRYSQIASGGLKPLLREQNITLSEEACDLLQHMFREDPTKRFTLAQVMRHPWVMDKKFIAPNIPLPKKSVPVQHSKNTPFQQYFRHRGVTPA
jgi:serine/threonine protein kinase